MSGFAKLGRSIPKQQISCGKSLQAHITRQAVRHSSTDKNSTPQKEPEKSTGESDTSKSPEQQKKKTMAELDEEIRMKMEGRSGEGGEAGLELEDGRPTAMKRGVRNNMFRLI